VAQHTPFITFDIIDPKIVKAFLAVPSPEQVNHAICVVNAHSMATPRAWNVPVCICTVQPLPDGMWLTGTQVRVEEASL
jgi:hypothetical protein